MMKILSFLNFKEQDTSKAVQNKQMGILFVVVLCLVGGVYFLFSGVSKVTQKEIPTEKSKKVVIGNLVSEKDIWAARLEGQVLKMAEIAQNFKQQNDLQEKRLKNLEEVLISREKNQEKSVPKKENQAENFFKERPLGKTVRSAGFNTSSVGAMPSQQPSSLQNTFPKGEGSFSPEGIVPFKKILHFSNGTQNSFHHTNNYVVAGTYAKAVLTSGVVASTSISAQGNPQPIMMRLGDQGNLPRGWKSRLKDAVLIGSCYGDLSSERAMCRIHTLSFVERTGRKGGRTVEKKVEGWIIGEDGAPGLRGIVVDRAGKVVREAFIAGILSTIPLRNEVALLK